MQGPTELLSTAWGTYKLNWKLFSSIYIIPLIVTLVLGLLSEETASSTAQISLVTGIFALIVVLLNILMGIALAFAIANPGAHTVKSAYNHAKKFLWSYILVSLLVGLIVMGGFVLLIIPGIIFMVWYSFAGLIVLFENTKGWSALKQSREYVRGRWWEVFGRLLFLIVIGIVIGAVLSFVVTVILGGDDKVTKIFSQALSIVLVPLYVAYAYNLYLTVKGTYAKVNTEKQTEQPQEQEIKTQEGQQSNQ